jgi:hypothetical protein
LTSQEYHDELRQMQHRPQAAGLNGLGG